MQTVPVWWVNSSLIPSEDMITKVLSNNSTSDGDDDGSDGGDDGEERNGLFWEGVGRASQRK